MLGDSKNSEVSLERVLCLLDRWRHLPDYQLERRADILFALFLPRVLEKRFGISNLRLIPEFPIKKSLLPAYWGDTTAQSTKVDFLAVAKREGEPAGRAFLIELKTDMASRKEKQDRDLCQAVEAGLQSLVEGTVDIARATRQKKKYAHLLYFLSELGLVEYQDTPSSGVKGYEVADRTTWPCLELVYVQPKCSKMTTISFKQFAATIEEDGSDIGRTFAGYLREWAARDAGDRDPKKWSPA